MPKVHTKLDFLADIPLYHRQKPFHVYPGVDSDWSPGDNRKIHNLEWESRTVVVNDVRDDNSLDFRTTGFQMLSHRSEHIDVVDLETMKQYQDETEQLIYSLLKPDLVRKNTPMELPYLDVTDPLLVEGPPKGAHVGKSKSTPSDDPTLSDLVDVSFDYMPRAIMSRLNAEQKATYLKPGTRFRVINTWRPLLPKIEDRPLAFCDYSSIDPEDLIATDKVYPHRCVEMYSVRYNPRQRWYWVSDHTPAEPLMMVMYDSQPFKQARCCPHVSFENPLASPDAPPRESIETRSLVISKLEE